LVTAPEAPEGRKLDVAVVKQWTGGEPITARFLYGREFEFKPIGALWFYGNHKPKIEDTTESIWRRALLVPFLVQIPEDEQDPRYQTGEIFRDELPGILRWAVEGAGEYLERGLNPPETVKAATREYRQESDLVGQYLAERCEQDPRFACRASVIYADFKKWCEESGERVPTQTTFGRRLAERGFGREKSGSGHTVWTGLRPLTDGTEGLDVFPESPYIRAL